MRPLGTCPKARASPPLPTIGVSLSAIQKLNPDAGVDSPWPTTGAWRVPCNSSITAVQIIKVPVPDGCIECGWGTTTLVTAATSPSACSGKLCVRLPFRTCPEAVALHRPQG